MSILEEIEELLKSKEFAKSVNRHALNLLFRNTAALRDPTLSQEQRKQAIENIKAITHNLEPKPLKTKFGTPQKNKKSIKTSQTAVKPKTSAIPSQSVQPPKTVEKPQQEAYPFPEDFHIHHGVDPVKFKAAWEAMTPEQRKITLDWHNEQLTTKKIKKSLDKLYQLFETLKKQI